MLARLKEHQLHHQVLFRAKDWIWGNSEPFHQPPYPFSHLFHSNQYYHHPLKSQVKNYAAYLISFKEVVNAPIPSFIIINSESAPPNLMTLIHDSQILSFVIFLSQSPASSYLPIFELPGDLQRFQFFQIIMMKMKIMNSFPVPLNIE